MWVPEDEIWVMVLIVAMAFTVIGLLDDSDFEDPDYPTYFGLIIRRPVFFFFAFMFWSAWSGMTAAISNCSGQFASCFTTLSQTATTTAMADPYSTLLSQIGLAMTITTFILIWFFLLLNVYTIMRRGYLAKRRPPPETVGTAVTG